MLHKRHLFNYFIKNYCNPITDDSLSFFGVDVMILCCTLTRDADFATPTSDFPPITVLATFSTFVLLAADTAALLAAFSTFALLADGASAAVLATFSTFGLLSVGGAVASVMDNSKSEIPNRNV